MTEEILGKVLFSHPTHTTFETGYNITDPAIFIFRRIWQAKVIEEIEEALFTLKLPARNELTHKNTASVTWALEEVFKDLMRPDLLQKLEEWCKQPTSADRVSKLTRDSRERIGSMALDVFFEVIFERDSSRFFNDTREAIVLSGVYVTYPWAEAEVRQVLKQGVTPHRLLSFIDYFSKASHATKKDQMTRIRKFLKMVLNDSGRVQIQDRRNEPLANYSVCISNWSKEARYKLACALVANGMYEECLDYNLAEALEAMTIKFCGGYVEKDDGLTQFSEANTTMDAGQALEKACEDKEWGHMWSVITRLAFKHGVAKFITYFPQNLGATMVQGRLAFLWQYPTLRYSMDPKFIGL